MLIFIELHVPKASVKPSGFPRSFPTTTDERLNKSGPHAPFEF